MLGGRLIRWFSIFILLGGDDNERWMLGKDMALSTLSNRETSV